MSQEEPTPPTRDGGTSGVLTACEAARFISNAAQSLQDFGLVFDDSLSPDMIEHILIIDEWSCDACGATTVPICPATNLPHRRRLVRIAQDILRVIARKAGKVYARSAELTERVDGKMRVRTQRRMVMNPQLFLLAFYFAALPSEEVNPFVAECAHHLLDLLRQLQSYGTRSDSGMSESYSLALLKSFYTAWREYVEHTSGAVQALGRSDQRLSQDQLFNGTRSALLAAAQESVREPRDDNLRTFVNLLYQRITRLASTEQLEEIDKELERTRTPSTDRVNDSPAIYTSNPPLLSDVNTSHSEGERELLTSSPHTLKMGPELPPDWYVDEHGRSRPQPGHEERAKRELFLRMEYRSRKAYEAALNLQPQKTENERLRDEVATAVSTAQLSLLVQQMNQPVPQFEMIPHLLSLVQKSLVDALPSRQRPQLEQEFRDALDWNLVVRRSRQGSAALSSLLQFVMHKVNMYGSPAREETLREETKVISKNLENLSPDFGNAVAEAFRFIFRAIRDLHEDIAKYSLMILSGHLRGNAVQYIREFVKDCFPPPKEWSSSITFLQSFINTESVREWSSLEEFQTATATTPAERRLQSALLFGTVELLRSGRHTSENRWALLPAEIFYFEKPGIFGAANMVQECTLLLLLEGTVSNVLSAKRLRPLQIADTLRQLHSHILSLLARDLVLTTLKESVVDFLESSFPSADPAHPTFTPTEVSVVLGTIDKMTDTENPLYIAFEQKVLSTVCHLMQGRPNPPILGLVTEAVTHGAGELRKMLTFNWEVYAPTYRHLLSIEAVSLEP